MVEMNHLIFRTTSLILHLPSVICSNIIPYLKDMKTIGGSVGGYGGGEGKLKEELDFKYQFSETNINW